VVIQFLVDASKAAGDAAKFAASLGKVDTEAGTLDRTLDSLETELDSIGGAADAVKTDMQHAGVGFDSAADDSEDAARRIRQSAQDMAQGVHQGAGDIDTETGNIQTSMKEAGSEAGAEFIGNVAEGIGSGTANVTEVMQGTLGGLTNLAATLGGPVGAAAGAAAAGIGLVFAAVKGEAEKAKAKIDAMREALEGVADLGGEVAEQAIFDQWVKDAQETTGKLENVSSALDQADVDADDFHAALAGNPSAIAKVRTALQQQGAEIITNKKETGKITEEQQRYLDTFPDILQDIHGQDEALGAVRREHDAIVDLTGDTADNAEDTKNELDGAAGKARALSDELDNAARDRNATINVNVKYKDPKGNPTNSRPVGLAAGPQATQQQVAPQVTVNLPRVARVTDEQVYRAVHRVMMAGDARNGRRVIVG
jgi:hypothetical protein